MTAKITPRSLRFFDLDHVLHLKKILEVEGFTDRISKIVSFYAIQHMCDHGLYRTTHIHGETFPSTMVTALTRKGYEFTESDVINLVRASKIVCKDYYRSRFLFDA